MEEIWRYLIAEIQALGWRCVALGPEFWACLSFVAVMSLMAVILIFIWK